MLAAVLLFFPLTSHGGSATWKAAPSSGNWNTAGNWTPATVPNGFTDTATFNTSSILSISLPLTVDLDGMVFNASANAFTFTIGAGFTLSLAGTGITNNSTNTQNFVTAVNGSGDRGFLNFSNSATAGDTTSVTNSGATASGFFGGATNFFNDASAEEGAFTNNGGTVSGSFAGSTSFWDSATAANATFTNNSGAHEAQTGFTNFNGSSNAGGASFINNPAGLNDTYGGATNFYGTSSALIGNFANNGATVQGAYGGETFFHEDSTAANGTFGNNGSNADGAFGGRTWFFDSSNADSGTFNNNVGAGSDAGLTSFGNSASAGNGLFFNAGGAIDFGPSGATFFNDNSTAATGTFINSPGAVDGAFGGGVFFYGSSTAGNGVFANNVAAGAGSGNVGFFQTSNAGSALFSNGGGAAAFEFGGYTSFSETSSASSGTFNNFSATVTDGFGGHTTFNDNSSAGNGTFNNNGSAVVADGGFTEFFHNSTAGSAVITNYSGGPANAGGGTTTFYDTSTAASSTLIANGSMVGLGGRIFFRDNSTGGLSRVEVFDNGFLAVDEHNPPNVAVGSIEGSGIVYVGANNLTVGANNLATSFSGLVTDSGLGGALSKIGSGILTFENRAGTDYLSDTSVLSIANASTINLNFTGSPDTIRSLIVNNIPRAPGIYGSATSGAPNQLSQFTGSGRVLVTTFAVSRKTQGANSYDINLPLAGPSGVECRSGGAGNNYQIVVSFVGNVTYGSASVTSGTGSVSNISGNNTSTVTIDLSGVTSPQKIIVTINSLNDGFATSNLAIPMRVLVGDTTGNGSVNASDVSQTKAQSGQARDGGEFPPGCLGQWNDQRLGRFAGQGALRAKRAALGRAAPAVSLRIWRFYGSISLSRTLLVI